MSDKTGDQLPEEQPLVPQRLTQRRIVAPMDHEAARGRWQLLGIAAAVYGPPLVTALLGFGTRPLLAGIFPAVCLVGLVRGWEWARTWTQVTLGLGAIGASIGIVVAGPESRDVAVTGAASAPALELELCSPGVNRRFER